MRSPTTCSACNAHSALHFLLTHLHSSADSPNELADLDPGKAYIIGGIVDRNRHKNLCAGKARKQGIATARLPVSQFFKLSASAVLTVNQARRQPVCAQAISDSLRPCLALYICCIRRTCISLRKEGLESDKT